MAAASALTWGARSAKKAGETDERLFAVAAWREAPYFTDAERAALALTEAVTRLSDRADPVPDAIWEEAARHYDEQALAALILDDRHDQRLQPPQRHHQAGGGPVDRLSGSGHRSGATMEPDKPGRRYRTDSIQQ